MSDQKISDSAEQAETDSVTSDPGQEGAESADVSDSEDISEQFTQSTKKDSSISVPPSVPPSGISILGHKLWIGNLDKRLTE